MRAVQQEGKELPKPELTDPCILRIDEALQGDELPGVPEFEKHRAEILARARSVPLVFTRAPQPPLEASERVVRFREELRITRDPTQTILQILRKTRRKFKERRAVFLSEEYLFAARPLLALRMSQILRLDHLFDEPVLRVQRGAKTFVAVRREGRYWVLPENQNELIWPAHHESLANLLLFDRVRAGSHVFDDNFAIDLQPLQQEFGFSSAKIEKITQQGLVLQLSTYGFESRALVSFEGAQATLSCESSAGTSTVDLAAARGLWLSDQRTIDPIMRAAHEIIKRRLPFDEPRTEEGQQDGLLRYHFSQAYRRYRNFFEFNGDKYYVFDGYGHPRLPEVCIDFITDAFDWGTGGHWPKKGEKRLRVKGAFHFASMGIENPRSVESLAAFATDVPEWFDMIWLEKAQQVKFRHRERFFHSLLDSADRYRRGDVIFIYGLRDDGKFHYHSFLIDEKDPVTGIPTVVLANAGPPQARSWEGEMQNAPGRSIVARMRVRRDILAMAQRQARENPGIPLTPPERPDDSTDALEARP